MSFLIHNKGSDRGTFICGERVYESASYSALITGTLEHLHQSKHTDLEVTRKTLGPFILSKEGGEKAFKVMKFHHKLNKRLVGTGLGENIKKHQGRLNWISFSPPPPPPIFSFKLGLSACVAYFFFLRITALPSRMNRIISKPINL